MHVSHRQHAKQSASRWLLKSSYCKHKQPRYASKICFRQARIAASKSCFLPSMLGAVGGADRARYSLQRLMAMSVCLLARL